MGPPAGDHRGTAVSFALEGVHPHDVAELLAREGVYIRAGHHCAQPLMRAPRRAGHHARLVRACTTRATTWTASWRRWATVRGVFG